jgi:hypothetical protein
LLTVADIKAWHSKSNPVNTSAQLPADAPSQLFLGPEYCPRKNPARSLPSHFDLKQHAS